MVADIDELLRFVQALVFVKGQGRSAIKSEGPAVVFDDFVAYLNFGDLEVVFNRIDHQVFLGGLILLLIFVLLYLCFGAVMDLMVFVALYSWLVSRAPAQALGTGGRP